MTKDPFIKYIVRVILVLIVSYLFGSLVEGAFDASNWNSSTKSIIVLVSILVPFYSFIID